MVIGHGKNLLTSELMLVSFYMKIIFEDVQCYLANKCEFSMYRLIGTNLTEINEVDLRIQIAADRR